MRIYDCRINHMVKPLGFMLDRPRVSWKIAETRGKRQKCARVQVSDKEDFSRLIYDTGDSAELSSLACPLEIELRPYTRYYWRVEVEADNGEHAVSETCWFETAKMDMPWEGKWIGCSKEKWLNPIFVKEIWLDEPQEDVRLYICGLGLYEVYVNGVKCGDEYLAPGCNDYNMWLQYQTYEVNLNAGCNRIEVSLGNGWYKGRVGMGGPGYGKEFRLIAELRRKNEVYCVTDDTWQVFQGDILKNEIYDGEWYAPGNERKPCMPVNLLSENCDKLCARLSLPVRVKEMRKPKELLHTPAGETVLDMGQNMVGFVRFRVHEPKGARIRLLHGEVLQNGNFYNKNLRSAKAEYVYLSDGKEHILEPHFTYFGFRYVKLEGFIDPSLEDFTGCVLYSDLTDVGQIRTDHEKINRLISNVRWGQKGNFVEIPTDCPQRDERMGWTCDAQVFLTTACLNMDSYAFYNKYLWDLYQTQREVGCVTEVIPAFGATEPACSGWGDAAVIMPWNLYLFYGDQAILEQQYDSMKQWVDYIFSEDERSGGSGLWKLAKGYGDWLAMDHEDSGEQFLGATELTYISTAYYYYSTCIVAKAAAVLGKTADCDKYSRRAFRVRDAFRREYFTESGRLAVNTQTAYVLALFMGLVPEDAVEKTVLALEEKLEANNGYLKTGFLGTAYISRVLSAFGLDEAAYRLLFNEELPSWLYEVNLGATTVWERWNSLNPDGSVSSEGMNSFNHYAYGAIVEWMYRYMAGFMPDEESPGFKKVKLSPRINFRLKYLDAVLDSPAGEYSVHWGLEEGGEVYLKVTVPFDCEAVLTLPACSKQPQYLPAGTYEYRYLPEGLYGQVPTLDMPFNSLRSFIPARPLLNQYFPNWINITRFFGQDSLPKLCKIPFLGLDAENLPKLEEALAQL